MNEMKAQIDKAMDSLPKPYREAVSEFNVTDMVEKIANNFNLNKKERVELDREVSYLLLQMQRSVGFMERLENKLSLSESKVAQITKSVTKNILKPLENKMKDSGHSMPVPKPPSHDNDAPPTPDYGGGSDPYREPPE